MKKLKCIKEVPDELFVCTAVTVGEIYEQDDSYDDYDDYFITDDTGKKRYYAKRFFKELK